MTVRYFTQGRVFADSPDSAAMAARDKHNEHEGDLVVFYVNSHCGGWWEYCIQLTNPEVTNEQAKQQLFDAPTRARRQCRCSDGQLAAEQGLGKLR